MNAAAAANTNAQSVVGSNAGSQDGGKAAKRRKAPGANKTKKAPGRKAAAASKGKGKGDKKKVLTIKDRIQAGAKVHVGPMGGLYIVYDGKKHPICA